MKQRCKRRLWRLAGQWPTSGYRRITQQLRREGWTVNHKCVERLMRAAGLHIHRKAKRRTTTDSSHPFPQHVEKGVPLIYVS